MITTCLFEWCIVEENYFKKQKKMCNMLKFDQIANEVFEQLTTKIGNRYYNC